MHAQTNALMSQLDAADQAWMQRHSSLVTLKPGQILNAEDDTPRCIYFPISGSIALYVGQPSQVGMAVGLVGSEGAVGLQAALGLGAGHMHWMVQSAGQAYCFDAHDLERLAMRKRMVLLLFSRYLWTLFEIIAALTTQPFTQDIKSRLAHWFLLSAQRCAPDPLVLTHAQIAQMLGVRRASITLAAREMKLKRYVSYSRGRIALLNVPALEVLAQTRLRV